VGYGITHHRGEVSISSGGGGGGGDGFETMVKNFSFSFVRAQEKQRHQ